MNEIRRKIAIVLCLAALLGVFASCGASPAEETASETAFEPSESAVIPTETETETGPETQSEPETILPPEEEEPAFINPLTGEKTDEKTAMRRAYAISIGNTAKASPQEGLAAADILIEWMATITVTRFCALYQSFDGTEPAIGGTRSARVNLIDALNGMDVIFISAGGPQVAYDRINELDMTYINLLSKGESLTYRDAVRRETMAYEHSLMLRPDLLEEKIAKLVDRTEHEDGYTPFFDFAADGTPENGEKADEVKIKFGIGKKTTTFFYDAEKGTYSGLNGEKRLMDAKTGEDLTFRNLLILSVDTKDKGDGSSHVVTKIPGNGEGYFVCGGRTIPIKWEKKDNRSPFIFTEADGSPLAIGVGKTYMAFAPLESTVDIG